MRRAWVALHRHDGIKQIVIVLGACRRTSWRACSSRPTGRPAIANARKVDDLERASQLRVGAVGPATLPPGAGADRGDELSSTSSATSSHRGVLRLALLPRRATASASFRDGFLRRDRDRRRHPLAVTRRRRRASSPGWASRTRCACSRDIDIGSPHARRFSNPVAAVPSLHAGWAFGVGVGLVLLREAAWSCASLGAIYPVVSCC